MHNSTHVAATEGSVSHLALFCQSGTKLAIIRKANYVNTYQVAINEVAELDVTYIDGHKSHVSDVRWPWGGPFYLYRSPQLMSFLGRKGLLFTVWLLPSYWWYRLRNTIWMLKYVSNRKIFKKLEKRMLQWML